ncbi:hypothetical protein, partial [Kosakonia sp. YIM B13611]|uniref:hypothetical protein n=1 Tax=unclassified Kosakonia TaxID=2632876 RepID=UPI0036A9A060
QFKFDAHELNFVMNYVFTRETWYSFFVRGRQESSHPECPHRLSDKLLKSGAASLFAAARVANNTLSRCEVNCLFSEVFT